MTYIKKFSAVFLALILLCSLAPAALLPAASAAGTQLVQNSGFEENVSGWAQNATVVTWQPGGALGTNGCALVEKNGTSYYDTSQNVNFKEGKKYHITVYLKVASGGENADGSSQAQILVSFPQTTRYMAAGTKIYPDRWTKLETVMTAEKTSDGKEAFGSGKLYVRIGKDPQNGITNYYIDEFSCVEYESDEIVNGNMEYGTAGWNAGAGTTLSQAEGGANGTGYSAKVEISGTNEARVAQNFNFQKGTLYLISMWIRLEAGSSVAQVLISHTDPADTGTEYLAQGTPVDTNWKQFKIYYRYDRAGDTGAGDLYFRVGEDPKNSKINFYFDEVEVTPVTWPLLNGDFDFDTKEWDTQNATISYITGDTATGAGGAAQVTATQPGGTISQDLTGLEADEIYTIEYYMKSAGAEFSATPVLTAGGETIELGAAEPVTGEWQLYQFRFVNENALTDATFSWQIDAAEAVSYYVDEVVFEVSKPKIKGITIEGLPLVGETLSASYSFDNFGLDEEEQGTEYTWYKGSGLTWTEIKSGTCTAADFVDLVLTEDLAGLQIKLELVPQDAAGNVGDLASTMPVTILLPLEVQGGLDGSVEANGTVSANLTLTNNTADDMWATVFVTVYDETGNMVDIVCEKGLLTAQGGYAGFAPSVTLPEVVDGYSVRLLIWEGAEPGVTNMRVLTDFSEIAAPAAMPEEPVPEA